MKAKSVSVFLISALVLLLIWISCQDKVNKRELALEDQMKQSLVVFIDSCWNGQDMVLFQDLASEDFIRNLNGISVAKNINEMEAHMKVFFTAFPDLKVSLEETEIKNNKIFLLWQSTGTNTGVFGEVPPTGKKVKINGLSQLYFDETGKLYREDVYYNELDLLQQLGYSLTPPNME